MAKEKDTDTVVVTRADYGSIIDSERDATELMDKKLTPATIKILLRQLDENSPEYQALKQKYLTEVVGTKQKGVIRLKDKDNAWEEQKNKSKFIDYSYRVDKEIPVFARLNNHKAKQAASKKSAAKVKPPVQEDILISTPLNQPRTNKTMNGTKKSAKNAPLKTTNLIKPPLKDSELINDEFNTFSNWNSLDVDRVKTKLGSTGSEPDETRTIIRRNETEEITTIRRDLRPILAQQISQIKRNGLSVVDFVVDSDDKIEIEKGDEEILVRLIKQNQVEINLNEFAARDIVPPKPTPVKIIRTAEDPLSMEERLILRLENKARFYKLNAEEQTQLEHLKATFVLKTKQKNNKKETAAQKAKNKKGQDATMAFANEQAELENEDCYKTTNYNHQYDEKKRPNVDQRLVYEQKMLQYLLEVRQQYEQGYNRQISQELADFNRAINLSRTIKTKDEKLNEEILQNRNKSIALLRKHVMLLNQKQYAEIKLLDKQVLKYKNTKGNIEEFIKRQKEFQRLLRIREEVKENRQALIESLRVQAQLMQEAHDKK
ncbi:MAG: hypothetical protein EIB84_01280 [Spiroplasma poulsonii]|uniref:Uncharacterized protein n=1 Tax=Spiroplasma poulsonii TaxID=2138 RepID=A0A2P6FC80_9MOLU|nr:hypothetical protein [Spiroplasma poulsonii]KAF0851448.1 hypothetical protein MSROBK_008750 [Spiroplasma poulsonii]MBW1241531.1 hypothetical protein [Spiroplasma poulsonii]PQM31042.1 hypothetical protein SMSRO_SF008400 [Spiroplasma poulsonii]PWF96041.1 hypothetical protein SMSE_14790 [Spiroplasma poulsonii]PWF98815.1 hypothetical protein SMH99_13780 [Spiroplasma poulsonii]